MTRYIAVCAALALTVAACGGGDDARPVTVSTEADSSDSVAETTAARGDLADTNADIVNQQPPGQAMVSVDGLEFILVEPGGIACSIAPDAITFSFRAGDNEIVLGGGSNRFDSGWMGDIVLTVANPESEPGPISYSTDLAEDASGLAIDGDSMSYVGPMLKQPANDGSNPPQVEVGEGTISATCP